MSKTTKENSTIVDRYFSLHASYQALIWFILILVIKHDTLLAPPIWDAASAIFAPAIFLSETNFNLLQLIQQEDWWLGGPNTQTSSLWTWIVALIIYVTKSPTITYLLLHLLTFAVTAIALSTLLRCIDQYAVERSLILLSGALFISTPLLLVQVGFMYIDLLVMCFSIFAYSAWQKEKEGLAVIFALFALSFKLTGLAIAVSIGLVLCLRFLVNPTIRRVWLASSIVLFFIILMSWYSWLGGIEQTHGMSWGMAGEKMFRNFYGRASTIAEIFTFILVGLISSLILLFLSDKCISKRTSKESLFQYEPFAGTRMVCASLLTVFCSSIAYATYQGYLFLPRYVLPMLPFAIISILLLVKVVKFEAGVRVLFLVLCILNIYNHNGTLYYPDKSFGITERTNKYKSYSQGHAVLIEKISSLPDDVPIFVSRGIYYLSSHPMMGRMEKTKPNIVKAFHPEYSSKNGSDFPDNYYLVVSTLSRAHGGRKILNILREMRHTPEREVKEIYSSSSFATFYMSIHYVQTKEPDRVENLLQPELTSK